MATCSVCGNDYDKSFEVILGGQRYVFDCFECAIQALAPRCSHCGIAIIGHGAEAHGRFFCSAHCAEQENVPQMTDRVG